MNYRSHSRWAPLRGAAWFALGFIVIRVLYRVVFLGANGTGIVLWSGRPIHLDGPFRLISLFGPVTTGGIWSSVMDALPFALGILACGAAFAMLDVRRFLALAARARFARGILTALAIGVATYPALVSTWRSMRQIHRLRRERGGFSVLGPLFERTLERASTLGESMEVRGFGRRSPRAELDCSFPASVSQLTLTYGATNVASGLSFTLDLGDFVLVTGRTGAGKSTLLRALAGLHGDLSSGVIKVGGADRATLSLADSASFVGYVPQAVRNSFVAATVREELSFGLISQGFSRGQVDVRLREIITALRLDHLLDRPVEALSAGEAVLVALGAALVTRPTLLLLDEPFADLDAEQSAHIAALLHRLATTTQMCIVVAEHRTALLAPIASKQVELSPVISTGSITGGRSITDVETTGDQTTHPITALVGPNGSGKTTTLFARAQAEGASVTLVPEALADFFVRDTVTAECLRSDHTAKAPSGTTKSQFSRLIDQSEHLLHLHPRDLSAGQQLALAIAIQAVASPRELLIDEPTRGLDTCVRGQLIELLRAASRTCAVTVATHDADFVHDLDAEVVSVTV